MTFSIPSTIADTSDNDPSTPAWQVTYGDSWDEWTGSVAADGNNNLYSVGTKAPSYNSRQDARAVLLKYSPEGTLLWEKSWDQAHEDTGMGVCVDGDNDVVIAGSTGDSGNGLADAFIAKYNRDGTLYWSKTWDGLDGTRNDLVQSVIADRENSYYVCGATHSVGDGAPDVSDMFLLKYDTAGNFLWSQTWGTVKQEVGYDLAVDGNNYVYVAGTTGRGTDPGIDLFVAKYDPSGSRIWLKTHGQAGNHYAHGVATNALNEIFVTGGVSYGADYNFGTLLKYTDAGTFAWNKSFGNPSEKLFAGTDIAVDGNREILVTGFMTDYETALSTAFVYKFQSNGAEKFRFSHDAALNQKASGVVVDGNNDLAIIGTTYGATGGSSDHFLTKYRRECLDVRSGDVATSSSYLPNMTWAKYYKEQTRGYGGIAVNGKEEFFVATGRLVSGDWRGVLLVFNDIGSLKKEVEWNSDGTQVFTDAAVDGNNDVVVLANNGTQVWLLKYSSTGTLLWEIKCAEGYSSHSGCLCVNRLNEIIVYSPQIGGGQDLLMKFNKAGQLVWTVNWFAPLNVKIACDGNNEIVGVGEADPYGSPACVHIARFSTQGNLQWNTTWGSGVYRRHFYLAIDRNNSILIGGTEWVNHDMFLAKFTSGARPLWDRAWSTSFIELAEGVASDGNNSVYLVGYTDNSESGEYDTLLLMWDDDGTLRGLDTWGGASAEKTSAMCVDNNNGLRILGSYEWSGVEYAKLFVLKYQRYCWKPKPTFDIPGYTPLLIAGAIFLSVSVLYKKFKRE